MSYVICICVCMTVYCSGLQDMRQIWTNCHLYNKKETEIDKAGRRAESTFSDRWAKSGFAVGDSRARRNNAGIAAPKYEPNEYSGVPEKKLQRRTSGSKTGRTGSRKVCYISSILCCKLSRVCFVSIMLCCQVLFQ